MASLLGRQVLYACLRGLLHEKDRHANRRGDEENYPYGELPVITILIDYVGTYQWAYSWAKERCEDVSQPSEARVLWVP
jgi:hypothetical protein